MAAGNRDNPPRDSRLAAVVGPFQTMTSQGSAYGRFTRAIETRNLRAAELAMRDVGLRSLPNQTPRPTLGPLTLTFTACDDPSIAWPAGRTCNCDAMRDGQGQGAKRHGE